MIDLTILAEQLKTLHPELTIHRFVPTQSARVWQEELRIMHKGIIFSCRVLDTGMVVTDERGVGRSGFAIIRTLFDLIERGDAVPTPEFDVESWAEQWDERE